MVKAFCEEKDIRKQQTIAIQSTIKHCWRM